MVAYFCPRRVNGHCGRANDFNGDVLAGENNDTRRLDTRSRTPQLPRCATYNPADPVRSCSLLFFKLFWREKRSNGSPSRLKLSALKFKPAFLSAEMWMAYRFR